MYAAYGIANIDKRKYVIDHLIPLEVGGSNDVANLWPEPKADSINKDKIENSLHDRVCSGATDLATAQRFFIHGASSAEESLKRRNVALMFLG